MFGRPLIDQKRKDPLGKAQRVLRAVDRARVQYLKKTRPPLSTVRAATGSNFGGLPAELIVAICGYTDFRDVIHLRRVSRTFKELVDTHEHAIVAGWLGPGSSFFPLSQLFHPPKCRAGDGARRPTLHYFLNLEKRHATCSQLAYHLCERAIAPMFNTTAIVMSRKDRKELESRKDQAIKMVQTTLTKQLYYVLSFLVHSRLLLEAHQATMAADSSDEPVTPDDVSRAYTKIQEKIIDSFDDQTLISTHHALRFLVNSVLLIMSPEPSYGRNDELVAIILRGQTPLKRCVEFFAADSLSAPRSLRKRFMQDMEEERINAEAKFGGRSVKRGSREVNRHMSWTPNLGEVWFDVAKRALAARGLKEHAPDGLYLFPGCAREFFIGCPGCRYP